MISAKTIEIESGDIRGLLYIQYWYSSLTGVLEILSVRDNEETDVWDLLPDDVQSFILDQVLDKGGLDARYLGSVVTEQVSPEGGQSASRHRLPGTHRAVAAGKVQAGGVAQGREGQYQDNAGCAKGRRTAATGTRESANKTTNATATRRKERR